MTVCCCVCARLLMWEVDDGCVVYVVHYLTRLRWVHERVVLWLNRSFVGLMSWFG